jgi:hypothetical protein
MLLSASSAVLLAIQPASVPVLVVYGCGLLALIGLYGMLAPLLHSWPWRHERPVQRHDIKAGHGIKAGGDIEAVGEVEAGWGIDAGGNVQAGASAAVRDDKPVPTAPTAAAPSKEGWVDPEQLGRYLDSINRTMEEHGFGRNPSLPPPTPATRQSSPLEEWLQRRIREAAAITRERTVRGPGAYLEEMGTWDTQNVN